MVRSLIRLSLTLAAFACLTGPVRADTAAEKAGNTMEQKGGAEEKAADAQKAKGAKMEKKGKALQEAGDKSGNKNDVQALGSTISYGKRYVGLTLLSIATEDEDDDGQKGGAAPRETITEDQEKALRTLMGRAEVEEQIVLERFGVKELSDLTPADLKTATAKCNKKLEMM